MGIIDRVKEIDIMDDVNVWENYQPYDGWQKQFHQVMCMFRILLLGRRAGKSYACAGEIIFKAHFEPGIYQVVTPTNRHGKYTWRAVHAMLRPIWDKVVLRETTALGNRCVYFRSGSQVEWASADNPNSIRGEGCKGYVFDEFAWNEDMQAVWDVVAPAVLQEQAWLVVLTSPKGGNNLAYKWWKRGLDPNEKNYMSWGHLKDPRNPVYVTIHGQRRNLSEYERGFSTFENPYLKAKEKDIVNEIIRDMTPDMVLQEVYACIIDDAGKAFVNVAMQFGLVEFRETPADNVQYVIGVDLGKKSDYTVVTVMDYDCNVQIMYRWRRLSWELTEDYIEVISKRWNAPAMIDSTGSGDPILEELANRGLDVMGYDIYNNRKKEQLITRAQVKLSDGTLKFPDKHSDPENLNHEPPAHGVLRQAYHEFDLFEKKPTGTGVIRYEAPEGENDDCVISVCLANWLIYGGSVTGFASDWDERFNKYM